MSQFLNYVVAGLSIGAVYALMSIGVVVIYRISRVVNLAHGAMGIFATFVFHYELVGRLGLPVPVAFVAALGVGAALGVFVERALVGPVRKDGILATLVMTVGVLLVLTELTVQFWGPNQPVIRSIFSDRTIRFAGTGVTVHQLGTAVFVAALGVGLYVLLNRTRYGRAIEAITGRPPAEAPPEVVHRAGTLVGRAVASVANLLDLGLAVVAGSVALGFGPPFFAAAQAEIDALARLDFSRGARIRPAGLGADAPLVGAAAVALHRLGRLSCCP